MNLSAPARAQGTAGAALVLTSVASLQLGAALSSSLFPRLGPAGTTTLRLTLASLLLLALTRPAVHRWDGHRLRSAALLGVSMAGMNGLFYESIARIPLGTSVTVQFAGPLLVAALLSRRARDLPWVAAAIAGVLILGLQHHPDGPLDPVGLAFALAAGGFWAAYIFAGARLAATGTGAGGVAAGMATAALITLPFGVGSAGTGLLEPGALATGVLVAVLASALPYACEIAALARLPKRTFSILLALEPVAAALAGALLLGQPLTLTTAAAILLVLGAATGSTLTASRPAPAPGPAPEPAADAAAADNDGTAADLCAAGASAHRA